MTRRGAGAARLLAISDLHIGHPENRAIVERLQPADAGDWLIVAGDVADAIDDVIWALELLASRFERVFWVPGNHELLASAATPPEFRGDRRYRHLVERCVAIGVTTPEDPYAVWEGPGGPALVVPMFLLYDYGFGEHLGHTRAERLQRAKAAGVVCVDEYLLDPAPYPTREEWCLARVIDTEERLVAATSAAPELPTILVNHWPLIEDPTRVLRFPDFAQWCGTPHTADWHTRFRAKATVYGHLHIPRRTWADGVRFEEVSLGNPREWKQRGSLAPVGSRVGKPRVILPWRGEGRGAERQSP